MGGQARYSFDKVAEKIPVIIHGLSLSLGGQSAFKYDATKGIKNMQQQYNSFFFS